MNMEMLESIKNVALGKKYNWASHVVELIKINCKRCQEVRGNIHFPSMLIWIAMTYVYPFEKVAFTRSMTPAMKHFICFIPKGKITGSSSIMNMFDN